MASRPSRAREVETVSPRLSFQPAWPAPSGSRLSPDSAFQPPDLAFEMRAIEPNSTLAAIAINTITGIGTNAASEGQSIKALGEY
jgi:hypothetical protein